jgi:hypothetical protein
MFNRSISTSNKAQRYLSSVATHTNPLALAAELALIQPQITVDVEIDGMCMNFEVVWSLAHDQKMLLERYMRRTRKIIPTKAKIAPPAMLKPQRGNDVIGNEPPL